jgi:hypothetical protein
MVNAVTEVRRRRPMMVNAVTPCGADGARWPLEAV